MFANEFPRHVSMNDDDTMFSTWLIMWGERFLRVGARFIFYGVSLVCMGKLSLSFAC